MFSALLSAAIFGNVSSIMLRVYQGSDEFHEKVQSIKEFIGFHHLPKNLATRLQESFQHTWSYTNGIDMNNVSTCMKKFELTLIDMPFFPLLTLYFSIP